MLFLLIGGARLDAGDGAQEALRDALGLAAEMGAKPVLVGEVMHHATPEALGFLRTTVAENPDLVVVGDPDSPADAIASMVLPESAYTTLLLGSEGGLEVAVAEHTLSGDAPFMAHWCPSGTSRSDNLILVGPSWGLPGSDIPSGTVLVDTDEGVVEFYESAELEVVHVEAPGGLAEPVPEGKGVLVVRGEASSWGDVAAYVEKARTAGYFVTVQVSGAQPGHEDDDTVEEQVRGYLKGIGVPDVEGHMELFEELV